MTYAGKTGEGRRFQASRDARSGNESLPAAWLAAGAAIGLLVGAGLALFFAPRDGAGTRREVGHRARRLGRNVSGAWDDLRLELREARRRLRRARRRARLAAAEHDPD